MSQNPGAGHNSGDQDAWIKEKFREYAECDAISKKQNDKRASIREELKDRGIDPKAFVDSYTVAKKKTKGEKDGYAESQAVCWNAMEGLDQGVLFSFMLEKKEKKEKAKKDKPEKPKKQNLTGTPGFGNHESAASAASKIHKAQDEKAA